MGGRREEVEDVLIAKTDDRAESLGIRDFIHSPHLGIIDRTAVFLQKYMRDYSNVDNNDIARCKCPALY